MLASRDQFPVSFPPEVESFSLEFERKRARESCLEKGTPSLRARNRYKRSESTHTSLTDTRVMIKTVEVSAHSTEAQTSRSDLQNQVPRNSTRWGLDDWSVLRKFHIVTMSRYHYSSYDQGFVSHRSQKWRPASIKNCCNLSKYKSHQIASNSA